MEEKNQKKRLSMPVTRRDFSKLVGAFGLTSTLLGWSKLTNAGLTPSIQLLPGVISAIHEKRYKKKAKFNLKFGAADFNAEKMRIMQQGGLFFVSDLEDRTDGEIRVEYIGSNQICTQLNCIKKCQQGIVDLYASDTANAAATAPYFNILHFAYLFPNKASEFYFLYHPKSEPLFREPLRKLYNLQFLWAHCELRDILMGLKYKDKPKVMTLEALQGTKIRVTGTELGRIAMTLLGVNPVPIAWEETLDGLKTGLIDGAEVFASAASFAGMVPFITQDVRCNLFSALPSTAMNFEKFEKLDPQLQDAVMESAYLTQVHVQTVNEALAYSVVGSSDPPLPGTIYHKYDVKVCSWPESELKKAEEKCSPKFNPKPWETWRERLNKWAGGVDIFEELYKIAREIPKTAKVLDVEPRRWWKG